MGNKTSKHNSAPLPSAAKNPDQPHHDDEEDENSPVDSPSAQSPITSDRQGDGEEEHESPAPAPMTLGPVSSQDLLEGWSKFKNKSNTTVVPAEKAETRRQTVRITPEMMVELRDIAAAQEAAEKKVNESAHYEGEYDENGKKHGRGKFTYR